MDQRKRLGEILVQLGVLTKAEVDNVLLAQRRSGDRGKFGQLGRKMGLLREEHILAALAVQLQLFPRVEAMSLSRLLNHLQEVR